MSKRKLKPRRSPSSNSPDGFDPKTPKATLESNRILHCTSTPLSSTSSIPSNEVESEGGRVLENAGKRVDGCIAFLSDTGEERTLRTRSLGIEDGKLSKKLKRKTRSGSVNASVRLDLSNKVEEKTEKRVNRGDHCRKERGHEKRSANAEFQGYTNPVSCKSCDIGELANEKTQGSVKLAVEKEKNVPGGKERTRKKTTLNQCADKSDCAKGWSEEQEQALQRAYFAAKPTPHFWKRVSKMVPGKSAQDCFDKIHSAYLTPPQAQPRPRAKKITLSSLSFSESDLLSSPKPKSKRSRYKRCNHLPQKTMRQLLQKQCNNDQEEETDLFSVFEATVDPSNGAFQQPTSYCTPEQNKGGSSFLNKFHDTSSSPDRKAISQLNMLVGESLISPPVLKQIKNKALHEKYIDQLHRRETKRKAALVRAAKQVASQKGKPGIQDGKADALNAAKNAFFYASDAITQFQQSQTNLVYSCDHSDNDHPKRSDDESEDWS